MDRQAIVAASSIERRAVADLLESLDETQLATPSLCAAWDVRTVGAHLASAVAPSKRPFLIAALLCAGNLHRANELVAQQQARRPVAETVSVLRRNADSRFAPPVVGVRGPLTDALVHAGDMRLPLGLGHDPVGAHVRAGLEFVTEGRPIGFVPRGRLAGFRLAADDFDWSWGTGPLVSGRGIDLLMGACGRTAVFDRLSGPGVGMLRDRVGPAAEVAD